MNDNSDKNKLYFYNNNDFSWVKNVENHFPSIKEELLKVMNTPASEMQKIWRSTHADYVENTSSTLSSWKTFTMMFMGIRNRDLCAMCPRTHEVMSQVPEILSYEFSWMEPHTHILPHKGYSRMILRCHLPLIVPDESLCAIRVGDQTHHWKEGELVIFDDSHEHEAWNKSDQKRAVLMFDIAHPNWEYNALQIARYRAEHLADEHLLQIAPKEYWKQWVEDGFFPSTAHP